MSKGGQTQSILPQKLWVLQVKLSQCREDAQAILAIAFAKKRLGSVEIVLGELCEILVVSLGQILLVNGVLRAIGLEVVHLGLAVQCSCNVGVQTEESWIVHVFTGLFVDAGDEFICKSTQ